MGQEVSQHNQVVGQELVRAHNFLRISAGNPEDNIHNKCSRKLSQDGAEIHEIQGGISDRRFYPQGHLHECCGDFEEVDNACQGLGTCVFSVCDFLRGQVRSLTDTWGLCPQTPEVYPLGRYR